MNDMELINAALGAAERAYAPYSGFFVGAALLCKSGAVYTGCNVENIAYGSTICAERVAFTKAISEGVTDFKAIAIANSSSTSCPPCGSCRQVMSEFCEDDFMIVLKNKTFTLKELLPEHFDIEEMY